MLTLSQRDCFLDAKYSGKKVKGKDARTLKFTLTDVPIYRNELNAILGEPHAYESLFDTSKPVHRPYLRCIKALELKTKLVASHVEIWYHLGKSKVAFKNVTISKVKIHFEGRDDALPHMSCEVETEPDLNQTFIDLIERMGTSVEAEIHAQNPADQKDLPLNSHGTGEEPEVGKSPRGRGRKRRNGHSRRPSAH